MGNGISDYDEGEVLKILFRKCMTFALKIHYPSGDLAHPEPSPSPGLRPEPAGGLRRPQTPCQRSFASFIIYKSSYTTAYISSKQQ